MTGKMGFTAIIINRNCVISFYSFWGGRFRGLGVEKFRGWGELKDQSSKLKVSFRGEIGAMIEIVNKFIITLIIKAYPRNLPKLI